MSRPEHALSARQKKARRNSSERGLWLQAPMQLSSCGTTNSSTDRFDAQMLGANGCAIAQNFYSQIGPKLVDCGYSAIPIEPGTKRPGRFSRGQWSGEHDWQRFCERLPTEIETDIWSRHYHYAGVGVALGYNQVVAVDIDSDNLALVADIESAIGPSPVGKVGSRGVTWFFRAGAGFKTTHFKCASGDGVDLLGPGTQTVIPPSIHPEIGKSYCWREDGEPLEQVPPDRLPMLPLEIADQVGEVMKRYGWIEPVVHEHARGGGNGVFGAVKAAAMDNLDAWLPELGNQARPKNQALPGRLARRRWLQRQDLSGWFSRFRWRT